MFFIVVVIILMFISPIFASENGSIFNLFYYGYCFILFFLSVAPWLILVQGGMDDMDMDKTDLMFFTGGTLIWNIPGLFSEMSILHHAILQ